MCAPHKKDLAVKKATKKRYKRKDRYAHKTGIQWREVAAVLEERERAQLLDQTMLAEHFIKHQACHLKKQSTCKQAWSLEYFIKYLWSDIEAGAWK